MNERVQRIGYVQDDESLSHLYLIEFDMRIGETVVKMGGVAGVETRVEYRRKGHASRILEHSTEVMGELGCDVGMLFGIPGFYHRFGYVPVLPESSVRVRTKRGEAAPLRHRVEEIYESEKAEVVRIYNRCNQDRTCSVVRDPDRWEWFVRSVRRGVGTRVFGLREEDGTLAGYVALDDDDDEVRVGEVSALSYEAYASALRCLADLAVERRIERLEVMAPPDHPFAECAKVYGCEITTRCHPNGYGMGRIIRIESLFEKLCSVLQERARNLEHRVSVLFRTELGGVRIEADRDGVCVASQDGEDRADATVEIPQGLLTQMVLGYRSPEVILADELVSVSGPALEAASILFPVSHPYMWTTDQF